MTFNSFEFIYISLPLTITIFYTLSHIRTSYAVLWLVLASLVFYGSLSLHTLPLLLVSVCVNYSVSLKIASSPAKKLRLILGLAFNFGLLVWFKFTETLPLGISFYTFTQSAYLIDVYRQSSGACGFLDYCRHVTFFGCIASGPIARTNDTRPEFSPDYDAIAKGITLFMFGLFKKVCIADTLANSVNTLFSAAGELTFLDAWCAALGYSVQLYCDFSGYSDMAIAVGLMFGMKLPQNFNSPYKSLSVIDFWRRWHMSLGAWVRDYIYIPLGGSREGELKRTRNVMLAMLFTGLWHGTGWTFVVWGVLHGVMLAVNHWWRRHGVKLPVILSWLITFLCVVLCWVVFRAETLSNAWEIIAAMFDVRNIALPFKLEPYVGFLGKLGISFTLLRIKIRYYLYILSAMIWLLFASNTGQILQTFRPRKLLAVLTIAAALMSFVNLSGISDFLYFQF